MLDQEMVFLPITQPPRQKFRGELDVSLGDMGLPPELGSQAHPLATRPQRVFLGYSKPQFPSVKGKGRLQG